MFFRSQGPLDFDGVTLSHLHLWAYDPLETLKWLASIVRACQSQKGGALASAVYEFSYHGDAGVKKIVKRILESVCDPLYNMLIRWIADGELDDPYKEFFIEACADVGGDRLWHEKYQVRDSMVPSFISKSQAKKILGTGKSINFLREVCKDFSPLQGRGTENLRNNPAEYNGQSVERSLNELLALMDFLNFFSVLFFSRSFLRHGSRRTVANYDGCRLQRNFHESC